MRAMRPSAHRVLITGGAKGIGLALARKFHAAGNDVTIVGRDRAALDAASAILPGANTICADITTSEGRDAVTNGAPHTSVLINNAGIQFNGEFSALSPEQIDAEVGTNLLAPMHLVHRILPSLLNQNEAAVINVTSILGIVPKQSAAVYCATKAALRSFSRSLRWQLEQTPVRVIEVIPPVVDTAMTADRTGGGKVSPEFVADEAWHGYIADKNEIFVGKARAAALLAWLLPSVASRIIRRS
jgi:short-subunit dehydrogenase involved in D-alanine esterification of teichoic acids